MMSKQKQKNNEFKSKDKFIKIGIVIITIIFVYIIYKVFNIVVLENQKINISGNSYYQYFYGVYKEYSGEIEVVNSNNATHLVLENDEIIYLDSAPIYYKDELGKALVPSEMEVVYPDTGKIYKVGKFTNIITDSNVIYAQRHNKDTKKSLNNAFLYDGEDLYLFLQETTIKIGKQKYKISPLSYVIVNYRQNVEIYNYDKDEYIIIGENEVPKDDIIATNKNYKINLSVDSYSTNSTERLLIKNTNYLTEIDY